MNISPSAGKPPAPGTLEVGSFSERRWAEWNGRYRDDVRRFWRGDEGMLGLFASRICGSASADMIKTDGSERARWGRDEAAP